MEEVRRGHIFPAIAIAKSLEKKVKDIELLFVGAKDRMEMQKVPEGGYKIKGLWISGFQRSFSRRNLLFPFKLISSVIKSRSIIRKFQPDLVIGTGGFASGPLLYVACKKGIPSVIQEQNSYPGITNKLLSKRVSKICVAYEGLDRFFPKNKIIISGNPVRQDLLNLEQNTKEAISFFNLESDKKTLLVLGGSLGARRINQLIETKLDYFSSIGVQVIWQCGKLYSEDYDKYNSRNLVQVHTFINRMDLAYSSADFVISRAGASSVSELCIVGKPVIFIPSPNVSDDHQTKNANAITQNNAAISIAEKDLDTTFDTRFFELFESESKQELLSKNIKKLALRSATKIIVDEIEKVLTK